MAKRSFEVSVNPAIIKWARKSSGWRSEEIAKKLKIKKEREANLSGRYTELEQIREQLEKDKAALQQNLEQPKSSLAAKNVELDKKAAELIESQQIADNYKTQRDNCYEDKDRLEEAIEYLEEDKAALNACIVNQGVTCP